MVGGRCALCAREVPTLTAHHLIPRTRHRSKAMRKRFSLEEMRTRLAMLCPACHKQVHAVLSEKELAASYHSIDALLDHPDIARFVARVATRPPDTSITVDRPRERRRR